MGNVLLQQMPALKKKNSNEQPECEWGQKVTRRAGICWNPCDGKGTGLGTFQVQGLGGQPLKECAEHTASLPQTHWRGTKVPQLLWFPAKGWKSHREWVRHIWVNVKPTNTRGRPEPGRWGVFGHLVVSLWKQGWNLISTRGFSNPYQGQGQWVAYEQLQIPPRSLQSLLPSSSCSGEGFLCLSTVLGTHLLVSVSKPPCKV